MSTALATSGDMNNRALRDRLIHLRERSRAAQSGKIGYLLLWALGIPIPVLLLIFVLRGCN
jgi:hypothetical protein